MMLFHYTCSHSVPGLDESRTLQPSGVHDSMQLVWMTDLAVPDRDALGLTSHILQCDRTEYRATVDAPAAVHWFDYRRQVPADIRDGLELAPGAQPGNWYVSTIPVPVTSLEKL